MDSRHLTHREFLEYIRSQLDATDDAFDPLDGSIRAVLSLGDDIYPHATRRRKSRDIYAAMSCGVNCEDVGKYGTSSNAAYTIKSIVQSTAWRVLLDLYFSNDAVFDLLCEKIQSAGTHDFSRLKMNIMRIWDAIREVEQKEASRG